MLHVAVKSNIPHALILCAGGRHSGRNFRGDGAAPEHTHGLSQALPYHPTGVLGGRSEELSQSFY